MSYFVIHLVAGIIGETSPRLSMMALRAAAEGGREAIIDKAVCSPYSPSIELSRSRPDAICVALHPGTVATRLSSPFAKSSFGVQSPDAAAGRLLAVIDRAALCLAQEMAHQLGWD